MSEVNSCVTENKLQFNDEKRRQRSITYRRASAADSVPTSLRVGLSDIKFASQVKNVGVTIDCYLTLHQHVTNVCASAYVELRRIASICQYLSCDATKTLISAFVFFQNWTIVTPYLQMHPRISLINSRGCRMLLPGLLFHTVGNITSPLFSILFNGFQYHVGFSTRSHLCIIAPFSEGGPRYY